MFLWMHSEQKIGANLYFSRKKMTLIWKSSAPPFPSAEIHGIATCCSSITLYKRPSARENAFLISTDARDGVSAGKRPFKPEIPRRMAPSGGRVRN